MKKPKTKKMLRRGSLEDYTVLEKKELVIVIKFLEEDKRSRNLGCLGGGSESRKGRNGKKKKRCIGYRERCSPSNRKID